MDQKSSSRQPRAAAHLPERGPLRRRDRARSSPTAARLDDGQADRPRPQADLQRRVAGGLRDAHRGRCGRSTSSTCTARPTTSSRTCPRSLPDHGPLRGRQPAVHAFEACRGQRGRAEVPGGHGGAHPAVRRTAGARNVSYTWSRFEGNIDYDYGVGPLFNTSSIFRTAPGRSSRTRTATAPCARTARTCSRSSLTVEPVDT